MEARIVSAALVAASVLSLGATYRTQNFIVTASSPQFARQIGDAAERYRRDLAIEWLGHELPPWQAPCPITVHAGPHLGAGGATSFMFDRGRPFGWRMTIQGSRERLLDSVLPHEVTHTIFATHFGQPLPRWADEGACTTVEHASEKNKQHRLLYTFLTTGRGIAFNKMFAMREYPSDILPLYSQGYSLARFLIAQGGRRKFVEYIGDGLKTNNWTGATRKHYQYRSLSELQIKWLDWVRRGCPPIEPKATLIAMGETPPQPAGQSQSAGAQTSQANSARSLAQGRAASGPTGGWYARQRDLAQQRTRPSAGAPAHEIQQTTDVTNASPPSVPPSYNSVTRPQPVGTPQPTIIPWTPPPIPSGDSPPMVVLPQTLP